MSRFTPHLIWTVLAIVAYALGYLSGDTGAANQASGSGAASPKAAITAGDQTSRALSAGLAKNKGAKAEASDSEQARIRMFEILSEADVFARYRDLCEFIPSITKENWRGALDAFAAQRRTMGRRFTNTPELQMVMEQIGEVAGADALNLYADARSLNDREIATHLMLGWSRTDFQAAAEWFKQLDPSKRQPGLRDPVLVGVARNDPAQALDLVFEGAEDTQQNGAQIVMEAALEKDGFLKAEGLLKKYEERTDISDATKGMIFWSLAGQKVRDAQKSGDPFAGLNWYEQYVGKSYMGPGATSSVISSAAASDPDKALKWLEANSDAMTPKQRDAAYPAFVQTLREQSDDGFVTWLSAHPDDPQHDHLAATAAEIDLGKGLVAESQRWLQMIADPEIQAALAAKAAALQLQRQKSTQPK